MLNDIIIIGGSMEQTQKISLDELMDSILKDMNEEDKKTVIDYMESLPTKENNELIKDLDNIDFTVKATLIVRYIDELFNGVYDKDYTEIEKLLNELPLGKYFFYDSDLLNLFNRNVYLFVLFEAANNRFELLQNPNIAYLVNEEVSKKVANLKNEQYVSYELYEALKYIQNRWDAYRFLDSNLLIQLYYHELGINHVSKMDISTVEGEYLSEINNLNFNNYKIAEISKKKKKLERKRRRVILSKFCAITLGIQAGFVLLLTDPLDVMPVAKNGIYVMDESGQYVKSTRTDDLDGYPNKCFIFEYKRTDDNKLIVNQYLVGDESEITSYDCKNGELYNEDLSKYELIKTFTYDLNDSNSKEEMLNNPYIKYDENKDNYRTVVNTSFDYSTKFVVSFTAGFGLLIGLLVALMASNPGYKEKEIEKLAKEYEIYKTFKTTSIEKLERIIARLKNAILINMPGVDTSSLDDQDYRM